jgi:hypothetical protein
MKKSHRWNIYHCLYENFPNHIEIFNNYQYLEQLLSHYSLPLNALLSPFIISCQHHCSLPAFPTTLKWTLTDLQTDSYRHITYQEDSSMLASMSAEQFSWAFQMLQESWTGQVMQSPNAQLLWQYNGKQIYVHMGMIISYLYFSLVNSKNMWTYNWNWIQIKKLETVLHFKRNLKSIRAFYSVVEYSLINS